MNTLICPGIFNVWLRLWGPILFLGFAAPQPTPPATQAFGGTVVVGSFLPVGPSSQSARDGPWVPMEVSAVALAICPGLRTLAGGARGSGFILSSSGCAGAGQGRRFVLAWWWLWLFVVSFVGCCPNRKAEYFVYAELIMSEQSVFVCL